MKNKKATSYLFYALGEIFLVMIGILLALQVNNWNQKRILKNQLDGILMAVSNDLKTDTLMAGQVIQHYELNNEKSIQLLKGEMTKEEFETCAECRSLITVYKPFVIQLKGYDQLKNYTDQQSTQTDSLLTTITQFYTVFKKNIDDSNLFVKEEVLNNLNSYREKPWFVDWTQGVLTTEMVDYFMKDQEHLNHIAAHNVLAAQNHLRFARIYKLNAIEVLQRINKRLSKD
ncbi:MAG: hypothetical protein HKO96_02075 [Flavobacteriaceae bacterium]|nr:hypothetical protein [Flavobacteriaceae bacterium]